jgi:hypothetical protein
MSMKKALLVVIACVLLGGAFYGGVTYAKGRQGPGAAANGAGFQRGQGVPGGRMGQGNAAASMVNGDVLSMDDKSLTVKLRDGGSKIVFFSTSTQVVKTVDGTMTDVQVGKTVNVAGSTNVDGSVTAKSIQLRPAMDNVPPPTAKK